MDILLLKLINLFIKNKKYYLLIIFNMWFNNRTLILESILFFSKNIIEYKNNNSLHLSLLIQDVHPIINNFISKEWNSLWYFKKFKGSNIYEE